MTLPAGAPPVLAQIAQRFAETSRGVVVCQLHRLFDVHAGFLKRHEDLMMNVAYDDGAIVKVHVTSYSIDGKDAGAPDVASVEQSWSHPNLAGVFAAPFDPRNFDAYRYTGGGASAIGFTSTVRDAGHGDGSFTYDARYNVVSYTYHPNTLPPHASSGEITDARAEVLAGYWAATQETQAYTGHYGPFAAAGTVTVSYANFRRFPDVASALTAL
ncbi:MAG: hypothetical protein WB609_12285 [Candidatus Cybelea sp.]